MVAEIITIGDEILIGQIVDTNSAWMAKQLDEIGIRVKQIRSIADTMEAIQDALKQTQNMDVVLITGGLGPTQDDVTKRALAAYFDCGLRMDREVLKHVEAIFSRLNRPMLPANIKQAEVLDIAEILFNKSGTAPGMYIASGNKHYFIMPGVPAEMKHIMQEKVIPRLEQLPGRDILYHTTLLTAGLGESFLAKEIADIESALPPYIHLAYLPSFGQVRLRLTGQGQDRTLLAKEVEKYSEAIQQRVSAYFISNNGASLVEYVLAQLEQNGETVSTAESCTGGNIAHLITEIPGSSQMFKGGVITYTNALKNQLLDVPHEVLAVHGAVSEAVVRLMADNARKNFCTDYAVATTGVAGPTGGTSENPVGTVWIGVASPHKTVAFRYSFGTFRLHTIERASIQALILLKSVLHMEI